jgi:hypothetical protein
VIKKMSLLKKSRKEKGFTLFDVEKLTGIPHGLLSQIENGQRSIPVERARELSEIYKVPIENIFEPVRFAAKILNVKEV